jgi:hypothetical protein
MTSRGRWGRFYCPQPGRPQNGGKGESCQHGALMAGERCDRAVCEGPGVRYNDFITGARLWAPKG